VPSRPFLTSILNLYLRHTCCLNGRQDSSHEPNLRLKVLNRTRRSHSLAMTDELLAQVTRVCERTKDELLMLLRSQESAAIRSRRRESGMGATQLAECWQLYNKRNEPTRPKRQGYIRTKYTRGARRCSQSNHRTARCCAAIQKKSELKSVTILAPSSLLGLRSSNGRS
jgi:hypothetical protein